MKTNQPYLFIDITDDKFIFLVVEYNEDLNFKVIYSNIVDSEGISEGKVVDLDSSTKIIKYNLENIEKKIGFTFRNATIINNQKNFNCINVSGFKKLNGSQINNEDITYILNNLKKLTVDSNENKTIIHLFNSNFFLDNKVLEKLPIGLYGELYIHHLTFFMLPKNELKNLKLILNNSGLNIERVILKTFTQGINIINKYKDQKNFALISVNQNTTEVSIFNSLSLIYSETFAFGSDIIINDISKVCSLDFYNVKNFFEEIETGKDITEIKDEFLSKKIFKNENFRKISLSHVNEIITARLNELIDLIFLKNINLSNLKKDIQVVYFSFEEQGVMSKLKSNLYKKFDKDKMLIFLDRAQDDDLNACFASAELIGRGWEKEALPIIQTKKSMISRLFSSFFE